MIIPRVAILDLSGRARRSGRGMPATTDCESIADRAWRRRIFRPTFAANRGNGGIAPAFPGIPSRHNVAFEEAAVRAAQIGFDLTIDRVVAFFSWPSPWLAARVRSGRGYDRSKEPAMRGFLVRRCFRCR